MDTAFFIFQDDQHVIITHNFSQRADMILISPSGETPRSPTMVSFPANNYGDWYLAEDNTTISYMSKYSCLFNVLFSRGLTRRLIVTTDLLDGRCQNDIDSDSIRSRKDK